MTGGNSPHNRRSPIAGRASGLPVVNGSARFGTDRDPWSYVGGFRSAIGIVDSSIAILEVNHATQGRDAVEYTTMEACLALGAR